MHGRADCYSCYTVMYALLLELGAVLYRRRVMAAPCGRGLRARRKRTIARMSGSARLVDNAGNGRLRAGGGLNKVALWMLVIMLLSTTSLVAANENEATCALKRDPGSDECDPHYADLSKKPCKTLDNHPLSIILQMVIALLGLGSLLLKKRVEEARTGRKRTMRIWAMDVAKQAISGGCAHINGMVSAHILEGASQKGTECAWYFVTFTLDTTLGTAIGYSLFTLSTAVALRYNFPSLARSGEYMDDSGNIIYAIWGKQMLVWCVITVAARLCVLGMLLICRSWAFEPTVQTIAAWFGCNPDLFLVLVMVACPVLMNVAMLWVQDQFLKGKQEGGNSGVRRSDLTEPPEFLSRIPEARLSQLIKRVRLAMRDDNGANPLRLTGGLRLAKMDAAAEFQLNEDEAQALLRYCKGVNAGPIINQLGHSYSTANSNANPDSSVITPAGLGTPLLPLNSGGGSGGMSGLTASGGSIANIQSLRAGLMQENGSLDSFASSDLPKRPESEWLTQRKKCCNCCLGVLVLLFAGSFCVLYVQSLVKDQPFYDPCYTQISSDAVGLVPDILDLSERLHQDKCNKITSPKIPDADDYSLRNLLSRRSDLFLDQESVKGQLDSKGQLDLSYRRPKCICCNQASGPKWKYFGEDQFASQGHSVRQPTTDKFGAYRGCKKQEAETNQLGQRMGQPLDCNPTQGDDAWGVGECCGRSTLSDPDQGLRSNCSVCRVYMPCDKKVCAARPDFIRNTQHYPYMVGLLLSLFAQVYVLHTFMFDKLLRRGNMTKLLAWAAAVEVVFCVAMLSQEFALRLPTEPCIPDQDVNHDGRLSIEDCDIASRWHHWPTWERVEKATSSELNMRARKRCVELIEEQPNLFKCSNPNTTVCENCLSVPEHPWPCTLEELGGNESFPGELDTWKTEYCSGKLFPGHSAGQRGRAVNGCMVLSFISQFTFVASNSFFFMITVDLLLNLYTSPFGSQWKRWLLYHGWTWSISLILAVLLVASGDWGVSASTRTLDASKESFEGGTILEDFCWSVNFGHINQENSNWPALTWVVYGLCVLYYALSIGAGLMAKHKISRLTKAMQFARKETIFEGTKAVLIAGTWLMCIALFYWLVVLQFSPQIIKEADMNLGPQDYQHGHSWLVMFWALIVGGHNVMTGIIWRVIVIPKYNKGEHGVFSGLTKLTADGKHDELQSQLRDELLFFAGLGIRSALRYPQHEHIEESEQRATFIQNIGESTRDSIVKHFIETITDIEQDGDLEISFQKADRWEQKLGRDGGPSTFIAEYGNKLFGRQTLSGPPSESARIRVAVDQHDHTKTEHYKQFRFRTYQHEKFRQLRQIFGIENDTPGESLLHEAMSAHKSGKFSGGGHLELYVLQQR